MTRPEIRLIWHTYCSTVCDLAVVADDMAVHAWFRIVIVMLVCTSERISSRVILAPETHPDHLTDHSLTDTKDPPAGKHDIVGHSLGDNFDSSNDADYSPYVYEGHDKTDDSEHAPDEGLDGNTGDSWDGSNGDSSDGSNGDSSDGSNGDSSDGSNGDSSHGSNGDSSDGSNGDSSDGSNGDSSGGSNGDSSDGSNGDSSDSSNGDSSDGSNGDSSDGSNGDSSDSTNGDSSDGSNGDSSDGFSDSHGPSLMKNVVEFRIEIAPPTFARCTGKNKERHVTTGHAWSPSTRFDDLITRLAWSVQYSSDSLCRADIYTYCIRMLKFFAISVSLVRFYSAPQCSHCKRCTSYGNSVCLSVRPSVCHKPVLCQNDGT